MAGALAHSSLSSLKKLNAEPYQFGIVVADWHQEITSALYDASYQSLLSYGAVPQKIVKIEVPGSFELTVAATHLAEAKKYDAIICLGCVIQGETRHFEFICNAVANGLTLIGIKYNLPVIFGVLTTDTLEQAKERAGGKYGNKGEDAAIAAVQMAVVKNYLSRNE